MIQFCLNLMQGMFEWKTSKTDPAFWEKESLKNSIWGTLFGRQGKHSIGEASWCFLVESECQQFLLDLPASKPPSYNSNNKQNVFIWALSLLFTGQGVERKITQYASHLKLPFGSKLHSYFKSKIDLWIQRRVWI